MCLNEEWRDIPGFSEYQASSVGRIRNKQTGRVYISHLREDGYLQIHAYSDARERLTVLVHRLVAMAFYGPPPFFNANVAHFDGTRTNNAAENLRWATAKENHRDRKRHQTDARGERNGRAILDEEAVLRIRSQIARGATLDHLAEKYGVCQATISAVKSRATWRHVQ